MLAAWDLGSIGSMAIVLPSPKSRIRNWLGNFRGEDTDLGARVLDAVTFLKSEDMEEALRKMVGRLPGWHRSKVSGAASGGSWPSRSARARAATPCSKVEDGTWTDRKPVRRAVHPQGGSAERRTGSDDSVAFFDDFAGTGQQACRAWGELAELLPGNPKTYLILIAAGQRAVDRIGNETGLRVVADQVLGPSDDIFSGDCRHFTEQRSTAYSITVEEQTTRTHKVMVIAALSSYWLTGRRTIRYRSFTPITGAGWDCSRGTDEVESRSVGPGVRGRNTVLRARFVMVTPNRPNNKDCNGPGHSSSGSLGPSQARAFVARPLNARVMTYFNWKTSLNSIAR